MADNGNGNGERKAITSTLALSFNHDTFQLDIKGEAPQLDVFVTMCDQAKRYFETQLKAQAALQLRQQLDDRMRTEAIVRKVAHS